MHKYLTRKRTYVQYITARFMHPNEQHVYMRDAYLTSPTHRFMQANLALRKGLGAVVGLNFDMLAPALQVKMMRPMTITRYKKVRGFLTWFDDASL